MNCIEFVEHRFAVIRHNEAEEFFPEFPQYQEENALELLEIDPPWIAHRYDSYLADLIAKAKRKRARESAIRARGGRFKSSKEYRLQARFQAMINSDKGLHTPIIELKFCEPIAGCFWYLKGKKNWLLRFRSLQPQITASLERKGFELRGRFWTKGKTTVEFFNHQWDHRMIWIAVCLKK